MLIKCCSVQALCAVSPRGSELEQTRGVCVLEAQARQRRVRVIREWPALLDRSCYKQGIVFNPTLALQVGTVIIIPTLLVEVETCDGTTSK